LKIDKKQLMIQIYSSLYGNLSPADCELLSKNCEFLHDNHHIIKLASWKMMLYCVADWFKRKVLWTIQYIKDWFRDKIEGWLLDEFISKTGLRKLLPQVVLTLASLDAMYFIRIILSKYGLNYLLKYILLFAVI